MAPEDRERLIMFVGSLVRLLQEAVEEIVPRATLPEEEPRLAMGEEALEAAQRLTEDLENPEVESALASAGLTGSSLHVKLDGYYLRLALYQGSARDVLTDRRPRLRNWWKRFRARIFMWMLDPYGWGPLKAVLRWANIILGSLATVFPVAESLREYKETIEADMEAVEMRARRRRTLE